VRPDTPDECNDGVLVGSGRMSDRERPPLAGAVGLLSPASPGGVDRQDGQPGAGDQSDELAGVIADLYDSTAVVLHPLT
jgi:hypothetical protein